MRARKPLGKRISACKRVAKRGGGVKEETQSRYRRIVETTTEGIWEIDAQFQTTYVNRRMADLLGYTPEEMLGQPLHRFLFEEDLEDHRAKMTSRQRGESGAYERRFRKKDGGTLWMIVSPTPLKDERGHFAGAFAMASDITERKLAQEALRESDAVQRAILEAAKESVFMMDTNGTVLALNSTTAKRLGQRPDNLLNRCVYDFLPPDLAQSRREQAAKCIRSGQPVSFEDRRGNICLENTIYPIRDPQGRITRLVIFGRDITDRKRAEEALRFSEERFRLFMDNSPTIAWVKDDQGHYLYVNKPYETLVGMRWEDLLGTTDFELWPPEVAEQFRNNDQAALESNRPVEVEEDMSTADGSHRHGLTIKFHFCDARGKRYVAGISLDITERKRSEEALKKNRDRLARINDSLLTLGPDHTANLTRLTALAGELMGGACALYNRLQGGLLCSLGQWRAPPDLKTSDAPEGHICYDVIRANRDDAVLIRDLQQTSYARSDPNVRAYGLQTYFGQVVRCEGLPVGSLCVVFHHDYQPSDEDRRIIGILASAIGNEDRRWQAEEALRISEKKFSAAFHANSVSTAISTVKDGVFLDVNNEFLERLGYRREEVIGKSSVDLRIFSPSVRTTLLETLARQGNARNVEVVVYTKDGTALDGLFSGDRIEVDGKPCWLTVVVDITERKRMELELARSREQLRFAIEGSSAGLWDWNVQTGETTFNERWAEIIGYRLQELEPISIQTWIKYCHPDDLTRSTEALDRHFRGETMSYECEARMRHKGGQWVWVLDRGKVVEWDKYGKPLRMTGTHLDITERKKTEAMLRDQKARLDLALQSAHMGVWRWEILENRRYFDEQACHLLGINSATFTGTANEFFATIHPDDRETVQVALTRTLEQNVLYESEYRVVWPDERIHYVAARGRLIRDEAGRPLKLNGILWDITDQKRAEEALRISEEKYRELVENLNEIVYTADAAGVITYASPSAKRILGYPAEETVGRNIFEFVYPPDWPLVKERFVRVLKGDVRPEEYRVVNRMGSVRWVRSSTRPVLLGGKVVGMQGLLTDITDRKLAEDALREQDTNTQSLINNTDGRIWSVDSQYRLVVGNSQFQKVMRGMLGRDLQRGESTIDERCPASVRDQMRALYDHGLKGEHFVFEVPTLFAGKDNWTEYRVGPILDEKGQVTGATMFARDITDRKRTEEALRQSEESFRRLSEDMPVFISAFLPGGTLTYVNPALAAMAGQLPDQMIGCNFLELLTPTDRRTVVTRLASLSPEHPTETHEQSHIAPDGAVRWQQWTNRAFFDESGRVDHFQAVGLDITDRKLAGNELLKLNEELEQRVRERTEKLQATIQELEAFAYSVSHDLRGPLRTIAGFSQMLMAEYAKKIGEQGRQDMERIKGAAFKMSQLIDDLLTLSRLTRQEMKTERVNLSRMAGEIAAELSLSMPARPVEFVVAPGVLAYGDGRLLRLVLQNLLNNAWKFTRKREQPRIEFGVEERDGWRCCYVRDNGAGFDMAYANKLFGAFQRLHREDEFEGLGIGLATVQRIIHRHGGKVWAQGETGKGATFYFTFSEVS
jgi:PAS domain S-box-containing protein